MKTTYGYVRVTELEADAEAQEVELLAAGCNVIFREGEEEAGSRRPQLVALKDAIEPGDCLVVTSLDRLGRNLPELIRRVAEFERHGVRFRSLREQLDTGMNSGNPVAQAFVTLAQFERQLIRRRTLRGLEAAKASGRRGGRPPLISPEKLGRIVGLIKAKEITVKAAARELRVSESTLRRARRRHR